ncbi:MAG: glycosyltransferase [Desulfobacteraceae bacterium]|nr:glycosyltransferase [Desulfobacteraceae bacterium]
MSLRIAMLSIHSSPLGRMGTRDTGGMSVYLQELAREMGSRGHFVDIFTRATAKETEPVVKPFPNVRVVSLHVRGAEKAPKTALYDHAEAFAAAMTDFCRETAIEYDLIHSNYWLSGVVGSRFAMLHPCPHFITFHTLGAAKMTSRSGHTEDSRRVDVEAELAARCDGVIAPTAAERLRLISLCGARSETIHVVPCGVNLKRFAPDAGDDAPAEELRKDPGRAVLLGVGRFDPMKGIQRLLAGVACLNAAGAAVDLVLVGGDGPGSPEHRRVRRQVRGLGMDERVRIVGSVDHRKMPSYYRGADAVGVASRYESFGLVVLEALACGTPVVSTPVGVAPEVIRPGVNGYLAAAGDAESLAQTIARTLRLARERDPLQIHATVSEFDWSRVASLLLDAYRKSIDPTHRHKMGKHREPAI